MRKVKYQTVFLLINYIDCQEKIGDEYIIILYLKN